MIPAPIFSLVLPLLIVAALAGALLAAIWGLFYALEPRCRASFQRHRKPQSLLALMLLAPGVALLLTFGLVLAYGSSASG